MIIEIERLRANVPTGVKVRRSARPQSQNEFAQIIGQAVIDCTLMDNTNSDAASVYRVKFLDDGDVANDD